MPVTIDVNLGAQISGYVDAPFDQALAELEANGFIIISLQGNAALRLQKGMGTSVSDIGNFTREGVLYLPGKESRLVRNSPILYSAEEATKAHWQGNEFYPTDEDIEMSRRDSVTFPDENIKIPTDRFKDDNLTAFAFKDCAENYGAFLREAGIREMPVCVFDRDYVSKQEKPFARQLWFGSCANSSFLNAGSDLHYSDRLRGVRDSSGVAEKIKPYTPKQADKMAELVRSVEKGDLPVSRLEEVVRFLAALNNE